MKTYLPIWIFFLCAINSTQLYAQLEEPPREVTTELDSRPEYPGANIAKNDFLIENIEYPRDAKKAKIQGRVIVKFYRDDEGYVSDAKVVQGVCESIDAEALRVVNLMPRWKPGIYKGAKVDVYFNLPLEFKL